MSNSGKMNLFGNASSSGQYVHPDELLGLTEEESIRKQIREEMEMEMETEGIFSEGASLNGPMTGKEEGTVYAIGVLLKDLLRTLSKDEVLQRLRQVLQNTELDLTSEIEDEKISEEKSKYVEKLLEEIKELDEHYESYKKWMLDNGIPPEENTFSSFLEDIYSKGAPISMKFSDLQDRLYSYNRYKQAVEVEDGNRMYFKYFTLTLDPKNIIKFTNPTEHMKLYVISKDPSLVQHLTNLTYKSKYLAVMLDPECIQYLPDADDSLKLLAVRSKGTVIQYINKPSKDVQLAAVKQDLSALDYIPKPHKDVLTYLKK